MIVFQESSSSNYQARTIENTSADLTLAFGIDLKTPGEILTKKAALNQNKRIIQINANDRRINDARLKPEFFKYLFGYEFSTINIAGNSLHTMKGKMTQYECDLFTYNFLSALFETSLFKNQNINLIRSGGQSGFDEAGIKTAVRLGIPALVLAPKGWRYRDKDGNDIYNEKQFKDRFN